MLYQDLETIHMGDVFNNAIATLHLYILDFDLNNLVPNSTIPFRPQHMLGMTKLVLTLRGTLSCQLGKRR